MPLSFKRAVLSSSVWWGWFKKCWRDKSELGNYGALFFSDIHRLTNDKSKQKEHVHARPELKNDLWRRKTAGGGGARWDWLKFASCQKKGRVINLVFKPRFNMFIVDKSTNLHIAATYFINSTGSNNSVLNAHCSPIKRRAHVSSLPLQNIHLMCVGFACQHMQTAPPPWMRNKRPMQPEEFTWQK